MIKHCLMVLAMVMAASVQGAQVLVDVYRFTSTQVINRRVTLTLTEAGPSMCGPWLLAGDSVAQFTATNGVTVFSNVCNGAYRLDIAGTPSRSFPIGVPDTNATLVASELVGRTNTSPFFYTGAQVDALIAGATNGGGGVHVAAGTNIVAVTNGAKVTINAIGLTNVLVNAPFVLGGYKLPGNPVLTYGPSNTFDAGGLRDPCLVTNGGKYYYYYSASRTNGGNLVTIGMAVSSDGTNWTKVGQVLTTNSTASRWDSGLVFSPSVFIEGGTWYMFYSGTTNTGQAWIDGPFQCGLATSTDGTNWTRHSGNPLLGSETVGVSVNKQGSTYVMLFNTHGPQAIRRATATALTGPWTKDTDALLASPPGFGFGLEAPVILKVYEGLWVVFMDNANSTFPYGQAHYGQEMWYMTNLVSGQLYYVSRIDGRLPSSAAWDWYGMGVSGYAFRPDGKILQMYNAWGTNSPFGDPRGRQIGAAVLDLGYAPIVPQNRIGWVPSAQGWYRLLRSERYAAGRMRLESRSAQDDYTTTAEFSFHISDDGGGDIVQHEYYAHGNPAITKARVGAFTVGASGRTEVYLDVYVAENDSDVLAETSILGWLDSPIVITNETATLNPTVGDVTPPEFVFFTGSKGDLLVHNGTNWFNRLGRGSNGQVLTADSTTALGLRWGTGGGGGGAPMWVAGGSDIYNTNNGIVFMTNANTTDSPQLYLKNVGTSSDPDDDFQVGMYMRNKYMSNTVIVPGVNTNFHDWSLYSSRDDFKIGKYAVADFFQLNADGRAQLSTLAGTGTRTVEARADGKLYAVLSTNQAVAYWETNAEQAGAISNKYSGPVILNDDLRINELKTDAGFRVLGINTSGTVSWFSDEDTGTAASDYLGADGHWHAYGTFGGGTAIIGVDGSAAFGGGSIQLNADGTASFAGANINFNTGGSAGFVADVEVGSLSSDGEVVAGGGTTVLHADGSSEFAGGNITTDVAGGIVMQDDLLVDFNAKGVILRSPDGTKYRIKVDDDGVLSTVLVP